MPRLTMYKDDYGGVHTFHLKQKDGTAKNLTGYTVTLKAWNPGNPGTLVIDRTCTVTDNAGGICTYTSVIGDTDVASEYSGELELTSAGIRDSSCELSVVVKESG
jgi:hypothetical protein